MIRTRFAPSPTGYMHIGNLRTALYAYCLARHGDGRFILRIEDTDRKRNVPKAIQVIYDSLKLAGLEYDEGPDKDGGYGPYIQSQRKEQGIYQKQAELLLERQGAFRCFCERPVGKERTTIQSRRDPCRYLSADEVRMQLDAGKPFVIRQRIPEDGVTSFHDLVYGTITIKNSLLDDQILLKSDGFPTYNFANVVDDHLMAITHVVRGIEYLSSTPKYNLLYASFGWEVPAYIHLPHIVKESGKKLSKREGDASFQDLLAKGYLPEAIINYIALLGWSPGDDQEFFTLSELEERFEVDHISKSKAAFSFPKLDWLNGEHIRSLSVEAFHQHASKYYSAQLARNCDVRYLSQVIQPRITRLTDIPSLTAFLVEVAPYDVELYEFTKSKSTLESSLQVLRAIQPLLPEIQPWEEGKIREVLLTFAGEHQLKTGTVMWPIRVALSGLQSTPGGATELAAILGQKETLKRVSAAAALLEQVVSGSHSG